MVNVPQKKQPNLIYYTHFRKILYLGESKIFEKTFNTQNDSVWNVNR